MQIFNNWSPYLVKDINNVWIGLEYVCSENDELWQKQKQEFIDFAICELENMGIIDKKDVIDSTLIKMKKVYPSYIGAYEKIGEIKKYLNKFDNLFCIGRNGMHKYNNMDHSMLTAMVSVDNIIKGIKDKDNIWNINSEQEYHESR
jgi:protoporphyrinogen oxidase